MSRLRMPATVHGHYRRERARAAEAERAGELERAWRHLERAHILSQAFAVAHVGSHVAMLRLGVRERDRREVVGQVVRIVVAGPASLRGATPTGNNGRARVPLRQSAPIPDDLASALGAAS
ncbi:MAG: DUF3703 domain-containing protein [Microthrixaceae bacterium]